MRRATLADVPAVVALKESLRLDPSRPVGAEGFLLGSSAEVYGRFVERGAFRLVCTKKTNVINGFGIALPDALLRASAVWERRREIAWTEPGLLASLEARKLGYVEQLAFRPGIAARVYAPALAMRLVEDLEELGTELVLATTVAAPFMNAASLALLATVGSRLVGRVEEGHGEMRLVSDVHLFPMAGFARLRERSAPRRFRRIRDTMQRLERDLLE